MRPPAESTETDRRQWQGLLADLNADLDGELFTGLSQRRLYATDASPYEVLPVAVARPRHVDDCRRLVAFAAQTGLPLIARGGGTGLAGQCVGAGLIVDCSRYLTRIGELDESGASIEVEPGVVPAELNRQLAGHGLMFGPDPSTLNRCNIGGMFGNNAWGAHAPRDGTTRDNVLAMRGLLSDASEVEFGDLSVAELTARCSGSGLESAIYSALRTIVDAHHQEILSVYPDPAQVCTNSGYALDWLARGQPWTANGRPFNLAPFLCGSEGTLAFATAITLRLRPRPAGRRLMCAHFSRLDAALRAVPRLLELRPGAIELLDDRVLELTRNNPAQAQNRFWIQAQPRAVLLIEFSGEADDIAGRVADAGKRLRTMDDCYAQVEIEQARIDSVWSLRRAGLGLLMGLPGRRRAVTGLEDTAVPPERLADFVAAMQARFEHEGVESVFYGSVSCGLIHIRPLLDFGVERDRTRFEQLLAAQAGLAREFGGCVSTKHGDGRLRAHCLPVQFGARINEALHQVKRAFDPGHLFNPGKIIDPPGLLTDLRQTPGNDVLVDTGLAWPGEGGLAAAAAQCQGAGACRKTSDGAMCPSYRASGEERLSTRGRANLIRAALRDPHWDNPELDATLSQCLACKSCRSECPANVDMARLKAEYLYQKYRRHKPPLSYYATAEFARMSALASRVAGIANPLFSSAWFKRLNGISPNRTLPRLARQRLSTWNRQRIAKPGGDPLILLLDPYTEYYQPAIGQAAIGVFEALGFSVRVTPCLAAGRSAISQGALASARRQVERLLQVLAKLPTEVPIVGLEPTEILCLREDADVLNLDGQSRARLEALRPRLLLCEELLMRQPAADRSGHRVGPIDSQNAPLIHTHCHQRALAEASDGVRLLESGFGIPACSTTAGCCGMAGDFGYRKSNYDLSMRIAGISLIPEINNTESSTPLIANGFSCRQQIEHGTRRRAVHLMQYLETIIRGAH